jgi:mycofactocin biosynthesis protein MftB
VSTNEPATGPAIEAGPVFDPGQPYRCSPSVALRPEPFGALVYHFGTRRLSFLKDPTLLTVVSSLSAHESARAACVAAGVAEADLPRYRAALQTLATSAMIEKRTP